MRKLARYVRSMPKRTSAFPRKQTNSRRLGMSALCQKRTYASQQKASLENLVGTAGQRQRNGDAERTGGLQVDEHLDFGGLLHRQIGRLAAFKNSPGIDSDEAVCFRNVGPVAHQTSSRSELAPLVDRGNRVLNRQDGELRGTAGEERVDPGY